MQPPNLRDILLSRLKRFVDEGYSVWDRKSVENEICPGEYENDLADPGIQGMLKDLEREGFIKLYFKEDCYLKVLAK